MELYQLKTFVAVAAEGSLSRAAEKVFASLPAVSAQIKALEDELGVRLFDRLPKGMRLTEAGGRMLGQAKATLASANQITHVAAEIRGELLGRAKLGVLTDSLPLRIGQIMLTLALRHPKITVGLHRDVSARVIRRVRDGEFDGGFALSASLPDGVTATPIMSVELVVALPVKCAQTAGALTLAEIGQMAWIDAVSECALHDAAKDLFHPTGSLPQARYVADSEGALRSMVASGLGAGILRADEAQDGVDNGEMVVWPHWKGSTCLYWISGATARHDAIPAAVRDIVLAAWQAADSVPIASSPNDLSGGQRL
jgi:DNA-binding transcriptional LysR family regulator